MNLQDTFYLTGTLFFIFFFIVVTYLIFLAVKIQQSMNEISHKAKVTTENILLAGNTLKAGVLRMFLNLLGGKGGEKNV